ncbi:L-rhamnose-binding lectin SML-like [Micropterus salmoides]|nr:L-rhamnose-binding lectin SML-like [Micropterus salmoides]XP_038577645.1 L-rhamnose-binding lectin SML-like [Micropterus salmoides]XP_038588208.1 L-rhamnose-binding lectin SML-like [Micropterus salmoides]XP_038588209.1 L-rhamnose-binding lectin SML-like [Micropterus salmoides]XP_038588292.1 L-rhamnose-binding lectin SML-like [Micropterus salmoides]XP_038588293.1 L-rhamnose-binding lectin SML-like [Micropterus salmoides]
MLCSRLCTTLLLAAMCLLMRAGLSRATVVDPSSKVKVITCDDDVQRLSCAPKGVISVQNAVYGRADKATCSKGKSPQQLANTKCSLQVTVDMGKRCNGKRVCDINPNIFHASDPCHGIYKYLETTYTCLPAVVSVTCEDSPATLQCDAKEVISVYSAHYGRRDSTTCSSQRPASQLRNVNCLNPTSKVAEKCNGKHSCTIKASNSVFGDPCVGTYKYLEVAYTCKKRGN